MPVSPLPIWRHALTDTGLLRAAHPCSCERAPPRTARCAPPRTTQSALLSHTPPALYRTITCAARVSGTTSLTGCAGTLWCLTTAYTVPVGLPLASGSAPGRSAHQLAHSITKALQFQSIWHILCVKLVPMRFPRNMYALGLRLHPSGSARPSLRGSEHGYIPLWSLHPCGREAPAPS